MSTQMYAETDQYAVRWDDALEAVVLEWKAFVSGESFQEGCERLLDLTRERNASKQLIDSREITAVDEADMEWMFTDWIPRMTEAGMEHSATVYPENAIAKMSIGRIEEMTEDTEAPGDTTMTTDLAEARS